MCGIHVQDMHSKPADLSVVHYHPHFTTCCQSYTLLFILSKKKMLYTSLYVSILEVALCFLVKGSTGLNCENRHMYSPRSQMRVNSQQ